MLKQLDVFREQLDKVIIGDLHRRIVLYGYDNYTGRFIKWYAQYYHNKKVDYLIRGSNVRGVSHEQEVYTCQIFSFGYQDVDESVIWCCLPFEECKEIVSDKECRDFYSIIYGEDYIAEANGESIYKSKSGKRDIQFCEYLEWKFGCDFVERVITDKISYSCMTAKELFPVLDAIHIHPQEDDAIFDFGCGKGAALTTFLDYGFKACGGVEIDECLYQTCLKNFEKLSISKSKTDIICGDILDMKKELDRYNWFYFFSPLPYSLYPKVIDNICESYRRNNRKVIVIAINPSYHDYMEKSGVFRLRTQLSIDTLQRVCDVFESIG